MEGTDSLVLLVCLLSLLVCLASRFTDPVAVNRFYFSLCE